MIVLEIIAAIVGIVGLALCMCVAVYSEVLSIRLKKGLIKFGGDINARINK